MTAARWVFLIVSLPLLAALGFDIFLSITKDPPGLALSTPGYLWTHYAPESFKWMIQIAGPDWLPYINFVLGQKSLLVGGVISGFLYLLLGLLSLTGLLSLGGSMKNDSYTSGSRTDQIVGRNPRGAFKYKRK